MPEMNLNSWQKIQLKELLSISKGKGLPKSSVSKDGSTPCILYGQLFSTYSTVIDNIISFTDTNDGAIGKSGDVLMPSSDVTPTGLATASSLRKENVRLSGDILILRPHNHDVYDSDFLAYLIRSHPRKILEKVTGSAVKHIYAKDILNLSYSIPPLPEQKKIAAFFSLLDEQLDNQRERISLLSEQKKAYMQKLFSRELEFTVGEEWETVKLGDIVSMNGGGTPNTNVPSYWNGDIVWITPTEVGKNKYVNSSIRTISQAGLESSSAKAIPKNSVLLSTRATLGLMAINTVEVTTNQGFQSLSPKTELISAEFLYYQEPFIKKYCYANATGSAFLEISKKTLEKMPLTIPSLATQKKITDFLASLDKEIENEKERLALLEQQKQGYLQQIFANA